MFKNTLNFVKTRNFVNTNTRVKFYTTDDGCYIPWSITVFSSDIFRRDGFENCNDIAKSALSCGETFERVSENTEENKRKSFSRAKNNLFDLLMCNTELGYFVTLTLSADNIDRKDYNAVVRKLGQWLDNNVRRKALKYILVPEFHKDGAIHFHGYVNADTLTLAEAINPHTGKPIKHKGKTVYNIKNYKLGFSTAIPILPNERQATLKYIYKYISKSGGEKVGGRYYLSGGSLKRPHFEYADVNYLKAPQPEIEITKGVSCKKVQLNGNIDALVDFFRIVN